MKILLSVLIVLSQIKFFAQTDSVKVTEDRPDAIYPTYNDFRRNNFIGKDQLITDFKKDQLDFMSKVMSPEKISYNSPGGVVTLQTKDVWGYYQNKTLYVNYKGEFFRVPVFGAICYLVATVSVINSGFYDPTYSYGVNGNRTKEIREFMVDFYDGFIIDFTMEKAEAMLARDPALFAEYKGLNRRNRKEQVNRYIRRFNEAHPVYFLKY
ncbi:MAG: hypothetical protein V4635_10830 [Bacteroidota bacterium]